MNRITIIGKFDVNIFIAQVFSYQSQRLIVVVIVFIIVIVILSLSDILTKPSIVDNNCIIVLAIKHFLLTLLSKVFSYQMIFIFIISTSVRADPAPTVHGTAFRATLRDPRYEEILCLLGCWSASPILSLAEEF